MDAIQRTDLWTVLHLVVVGIAGFQQLGKAIQTSVDDKELVLEVLKFTFGPNNCNSLYDFSLIFKAQYCICGTFSSSVDLNKSLKSLPTLVVSYVAIN